MLEKKYFITIVSIVFFFVCLSQEKDIEIFNTEVSYELTFKKNKTSKNLSTLDAVLYTNDGKNSYFTLKNMIIIDSLQQKRELQLQDIKRYNTFLNFFISKRDTSFIHYEKIGLDIYTFQDKIEHNWTLFDDFKLINNYNCKKAMVNFGGRKWIAWYALDIPLDAGPYKFYGLPGLILQLYDSEEVFKFEVTKVTRDKFYINSNASKYFLTDRNIQEESSKSYFFKIRKKYYSLDVSGRLNFMNRMNENSETLVIKDANGNSIKRGRHPKKKNFIENFE